jgi:hydrogenase 3 maturation protease
LPSDDATPLSAARLRDFLAGRACVVGVGNRLKADDAAGCLVLDRVAGRLRAHCVDAGVAPENVLEPVARQAPETILLIDAADFGADPGAARLLAPGDLAAGGVSTHGISLELPCAYWRERTGARIGILGIQPGTVALGEKPTDAVLRAVEAVAAALVAADAATRGSDQSSVISHQCKRGIDP